MNIFDLITKDLDTLREAHKSAINYAEKMADAKIEYTDKVCQIADAYDVERKDAIRAAINNILDCLLDGDYDKEATTK